MFEELSAQVGILIPAFLAGIVVLSTHVPLGQMVLKRGIIFLDLAIAQVAALGLILANFAGFETEDSYWQQQVFAMTAAVVGALSLYQLRRLSAAKQEALIGILFVLAASVSILLLSKDPHGGEQLKELLVGQILWVETTQLVITALISALILVLLFALRAKATMLFYPLFAVAVTLSTQLVGVYLVFASLIIPALVFQTAKTTVSSSVKAWLFGACAYAMGLVLAAIYDLPAGASIVCTLAGLAAIFALFKGKSAQA